MSISPQFKPALDRLDLVSPTVAHLLNNWKGSVPVRTILTAEIDPAFAGGKDFCAQYGILHSEGANCVIVEAIRGTQRNLAACIAPVNSRIDFNGVVKKALDARRVSLAPLDEVLKQTQMEYGSVTPVGLPPEWLILLDESVISTPRIIVGAGLVKAKLSLPGKALAELPGAKIISRLSAIVGG